MGSMIHLAVGRLGIDWGKTAHSRITVRYSNRLIWRKSVTSSGRTLPFDSLAAQAFAALASERRQAGKPISQADAQIAAVARSRGASLVTRNVADFEGCGIEVVNPWGAAGDG